LRTKFKGREYLRLHKILTNFSSKSIWECLKSGQKIEDILYAVPDEFFDWVKIKKGEIINDYETVKRNAQMAYQDVKDLPTQKEKALVILDKYRDISGLVFTLLKGGNIDEHVWDMVEPKRELPFKKEA
jgi:RNA ligase